MFSHDSHLPQVLEADHYTGRGWLDGELDHLFRPSWQFVGTLADLPRDGDFFTFELFDQPLIVWRTGGEVRAFLNVCPHRFSMLTHQPCGHAGDRFTCQYHGWQFDCEGDTRKIPDAKSFRPMQRGELALRRFRTATCGQLIFVNLNEDGPTLEEFLGPGYEAGQELFSDDRHLILSLDYEVAANWKIKIENSLESYHVDLIHPATFRKTPDESICEHVLEPRWTTFETNQPAVTRTDRFLDWLIHRVAEVESDGKYRHCHIYPNMMYGKMSLFTFAETVFPIEPGRTRILAKFFAFAGARRTLGTRLLRRGLAAWGRKFWPTVAAEDTGVMPDIQKGMQSGRLPSQGLISIREERLWHFQEFVRNSVCGNDLTDDSELSLAVSRSNGAER
ncbi:MAG: aromatic ring-hydroxylating oxygenase subunit alpha [Planctomycetaceae bacterium]